MGQGVKGRDMGRTRCLRCGGTLVPGLSPPVGVARISRVVAGGGGWQRNASEAWAFGRFRIVVTKRPTFVTPCSVGRTVHGGGAGPSPPTRSPHGPPGASPSDRGDRGAGTQMIDDLATASGDCMTSWTAQKIAVPDVPSKFGISDRRSDEAAVVEGMFGDPLDASAPESRATEQRGTPDVCITRTGPHRPHRAPDGRHRLPEVASGWASPTGETNESAAFTPALAACVKTTPGGLDSRLKRCTGSPFQPRAVIVPSGTHSFGRCERWLCLRCGKRSSQVVIRLFEPIIRVTYPEERTKKHLSAVSGR
jgi:hypothetical protein